ncbi:MAG TPA: tRNA (adenosine(37)-N6)-dimethylallyltransferase MiaA [Candidatus Baltobacteraceae bacterium]
MSAVLILTGATASGKSELAVDLARRFDAEIVGADSRQIYRGMPVGTAAPTDEQLDLVPHHLVAFLDPHERYSAARFAADATRAVREIHARGKRAIVVGGTGFYLRALTGEVELAHRYDPDLRERLRREAAVHGAEFLHAWLALRDARRASALDHHDVYRVVRALEIAMASPPIGDPRTPSSFASANVSFAKFALDVPLAQIDARIERRTDAMLAGGLLEEAERVGARAAAADAVGYPQALAYLRGWSSFAELRASLARATRRYARRQRAWFRSEPGVLWIAPADVAASAKEILGWV